MELSFLNRFIRRVGIDLGTSYTRIWTDQAGIALSEPSCVAVDERSKKVLAVGEEALAMVGRVGPGIVIYYPIRKGEIFDIEVAQAMLKVFLQKVFQTPYFFRPIMMSSVPVGSSLAHRQAVTQVMSGLGAREAYTIAQPLAAAIGSGVPIADASGSFIVQVGAGVVEAAIISLGSVVAHQTHTQAGIYIDGLFKQAVRDEYGLVISEAMAEKIKKELGNFDTSATTEILVTGQDLLTSSPKEVSVAAAKVNPMLTPVLEKYQILLKKLLSTIPPELTVDVIDKGILLSGGAGQFKGLERQLVAALGVPVFAVDDPGQTVIKGIGQALENLELFKESLGYER
ncbi:MAG TPA: rod shape-determining protein [Vitreimonas sp.]|nr:rod shape-determining protein [Vitreimonas sp.]